MEGVAHQFIKKNLKNFDVFHAIYHDQGLIPFKMLSFDKGVNFTINLPFVRTSPDHGTAYDIAWKKNLCRHYSIANRESYSIIEVAKMFKARIKYLPKRPGERYVSSLINKNLSNKMYNFYGKISLKNYIKNFIANN